MQKGLIFVAAIIVVAIAAITFVVFFSEAEKKNSGSVR